MSASFTPPSFDDFDEQRHPRPEHTGFDNVLQQAISRRTFLNGLCTFSTAAFLAAAGIRPTDAQATPPMDFRQVPASTSDTITVPPGYHWTILASWGDPLWSDAPTFDHTTRGTAASQLRALGDNNDGMEIFTVNGRTLLVVNNEYANIDIIHGNRLFNLPQTQDDYLKAMHAHGVTVMEIAEEDKQWQIVQDSPYNRRITAQTPMELTGPAAGHDLLKTSADSSGRFCSGTWNNCGSGKTPWGTHLACEENFNAYFSSSDDNTALTPAMKRYGIGHTDWGYGWANIDDRFDISREANEANRAGYVVEIDPTAPNSMPKKRTALGRFKHENAEVVLAKDKRVVVYMGDDERGEFLYRFVSDGKMDSAATNTPTSNSALLDSGTLHAAKFHADGRGEWLALTPAATGMTKAEICIHTRIAASKVGATTMDRPEWVATHPRRAEVYCALTNNSHRGVQPNAGGDATPATGPNPRERNHYGQIVRWTPDNDDHAAAGFAWNLYVLAGNPVVHTDTTAAGAGSANINAGNMFNSPDGLAFDSQGNLWIQTDGDYSNDGDFAGHGNNQMLVGNPDTGEIRRFMTAPNEAEITGLCWSTDGKTMFVGVQHPGEHGGTSHFPGGGNSVPRSSIIAVRRDDGEAIG